MTQIKVGDRVRYAKAFLQSTGQYCGDAATATGTVTSIAPFAGGLATVDWHNDNVPALASSSPIDDWPAWHRHSRSQRITRPEDTNGAE
jgi:hypothetical protein